MTSSELTFRELDGDEPLPDPQWPLEHWYIRVRDIKIAELSAGDLARAVRQDVFVSEILPDCLALLRHEPLIGEMYDGELLVALAKYSERFWEGHPRERALVCKFIERVRARYAAEQEAWVDEATFRQELEPFVKRWA